jgi:hypothetical protein
MTEPTTVAFDLQRHLEQMESRIITHTTAEVDRLEEQVKKQNGRIGRLESWRNRAQGVAGFVAFLLAVAGAVAAFR